MVGPGREAWPASAEGLATTSWWLGFPAGETDDAQAPRASAQLCVVVWARLGCRSRFWARRANAVGSRLRDHWNG